jgi:hypothetical protein
MSNGVDAAAQSLLRAAGGRPDDALALWPAWQSGILVKWALLPKAVQRGDDDAPMQDWTPAEAKCMPCIKFATTCNCWVKEAPHHDFFFLDSDHPRPKPVSQRALVISGDTSLAARLHAPWNTVQPRLMQRPWLARRKPP